MLTNFHLPKSSLLMLVSAFAGRERVLDAYAAAVARAVPVLQLRGCDAGRRKARGSGFGLGVGFGSISADALQLAVEQLQRLQPPGA